MSKSFPASFYRGGTSTGLLISASNLPTDRNTWQPILSTAMGSPDPYGRQLDGMGSGVSSTSKIMVVQRSERTDADVDYTFVQVGIRDGSLDMAGNCGNMSSAVGPFAVDEGLIASPPRSSDGDEVTVRMFNTNTNKIVHSSFRVSRGDRFDPLGDYAIDGVPGTGSCITLSFLDPEGAKTGKALPTGNPIDILTLANVVAVRASLIDVANPGVFVLAADLDIPGDITPEALGSNAPLMSKLERLRQEGTRMMGLDPTVQSVPKIVLISPPRAEDAAEGTNIVCRALSMQQAHKAVPLTLALNLGAACGIPGTLPALMVRGLETGSAVAIAHASGKVQVGSVVKEGKIESALLHRTARMLMKGEVFY